MPTLKFDRDCSTCSRRMAKGEAFTFQRDGGAAICRACWPDKGRPTSAAWDAFARLTDEGSAARLMGPRPAEAGQLPFGAAPVVERVPDAPRPAPVVAGAAYRAPVDGDFGRLVRFPCGCELLPPPFPTSGAAVYACCGYHRSVTVAVAR